MSHAYPFPIMQLCQIARGLKVCMRPASISTPLIHFLFQKGHNFDVVHVNEINSQSIKEKDPVDGQFNIYTE